MKGYEGFIPLDEIYRALTESLESEYRSYLTLSDVQMILEDPSLSNLLRSGTLNYQLIIVSQPVNNLDIKIPWITFLSIF